MGNEWLTEPIPYLKRGNWIYRIICFCTGKRKKKLTYQEMYLLLYGINKKEVGEKKAKELALNKVLKFYKDLHNEKLPEGI